MDRIATLRRVAPPFVFDALKGRFGTRFRGDYDSWAAAKADCVGYDSEAILDRVREATRAVVNGRAAGERDGIALNEIEYSWPTLASLLWVATQSQGRLSVVDFGGSLGSSYRQNLRFLAALPSLEWAVVEQPSFVAAGKAEFETGPLRFFEDLPTAFATVHPNVLLLSGVLQYLPSPHDMLIEMMRLAPDFIILDRTPLIDGPADRLTVQVVSKRVHPGSYPAWFFSRSSFLESLSKGYEVVEMFDTDDKANIDSKYVGALLRRARTAR